jgi:hypothetical protein
LLPCITLFTKMIYGSLALGISCKTNLDFV